MMLSLMLSLGLSTLALALTLDEAKAQGLVGEKVDGYVAAVVANPAAEVQALVDAGAVRLMGTLGEAIPVRKPENERTGEALSLLTALAVEKLDATALPLLTILTVEVPDAPNEGLVEGLSQPDTIVKGDGAAELDVVAATEEDTVSVTVTV